MEKEQMEKLLDVDTELINTLQKTIINIRKVIKCDYTSDKKIDLIIKVFQEQDENAQSVCDMFAMALRK